MLCCLDSSGCGIGFPRSISYDHTKIRCFGHHWQMKRCVWDQKLWTLFSPADPSANELSDPFANRSKENNTLGGVNVVQYMGKVFESTLTICNAIQSPTKVDIVGVYYQVVVQPGMGISLEKFLYDEVHTEGPEDGCICGSLFNPSRGFYGPNK